MQQRARQQPHHDSDGTDKQQQRHKTTQYLCRGGAKRFEHSDMIEMALCVTMSRQTHSDACKQHTEQATEQQKALRAIQRSTNARTAFTHADPREIRLQRQGFTQGL